MTREYITVALWGVLYAVAFFGALYLVAVAAVLMGEQA